MQIMNNVGLSLIEGEVSRETDGDTCQLVEECKFYMFGRA